MAAVDGRVENVRSPDLGAPAVPVRVGPRLGWVVRHHLEADVRPGPAATLHQDFMADLPVVASQAVTRVKGRTGTVAVTREANRPHVIVLISSV